MFRKALALPARWLTLLLFALTACSQPVPATRPASASVEQDNPRGSEYLTPALGDERRRMLAELGAEHWHQQDRLGKGLKVAILDSGFRDYRQFLGRGLPKQVTVRSFRKDRNLEARDSQHGILCGEVLHTLAPDATLLFANWEPDSPQAFVDAVRWAKAEGAQIVSCSLIMPSWSDGEGGGEVHRALHEVLGDGGSAHDVLCFASAGNTAQRHWCGLFAPDDAGWHRWRGDVAANTLTPWGTDRVAVELYGPMQNAYEVSVWRGDKLVGKSVLHVDSTKTCGRAVVRFEPEPNATYAVRVRCLDDHADVKAQAFHLVVLGGALEHTVGRGSIPFPGDGASVLAVGAVDGERQRLAYSSCGPNSRLPKPDFVATVPFRSLCRARPFAGTSAAAPQAAGLAALVWARHPDWTPNRVVQAMRQAALDLGPPGHDWETGYGLIRLPR